MQRVVIIVRINGFEINSINLALNESGINLIDYKDDGELI